MPAALPETDLTAQGAFPSGTRLTAFHSDDPGTAQARPYTEDDQATGEVVLLPHSPAVETPAGP